MADPLIILGILGTLLLSAFFSGIEIAFISADKLHIDLKAKSGSRSNRRLARLAEKPSMFIGTTLLGNTLALALFTTLMTSTTEPYFTGLFNNQSTVLLVQTILSTIIILFTAEFLPKSLFLINPNGILSFFSLPIMIVRNLLYVAVWLIVRLSRFFVINVFKGEFSEEKPAYGLTDLNNYLHEIANQKRKDDEESHEVDTKIFSNALDFKKVKVRDCMIPRTELVAVDTNSTNIAALKREFINSGYSKILVYKDTIDDIIGYCHSSQLFKKPKKLAQIVSKIPFVPEAKLANELLVELISSRKSMAVVVDEFGGTSGLVCIEDIIEEIFGDIQDEHDDDQLPEQKISDHEFIFSGRHEIDDLNERYNLGIPDGDYDTLGGFILSHFGDIPKVNDKIHAEGFLIEVKTMNGVKIDRVKLEIETKKE